MRIAHVSGIGVVLVFGVIATTRAASAQSAPPSSAGALFADSKQYPLLPRPLEIELALNAAPKALREQATVWVLEASGYTKAQIGTNAFACIVSRRGDLVPICWDAEGTRSMLTLDFEDARMRLAGKSGKEIDEAIAAGFRSGLYHAPARAGVSYMLSPARYRIDERGAVTRVPPLPHVMFYAPNLTDADVGGARGGYVFINRVGPDGMMIVPVGEKEKDAIMTESRSLIAAIEQVLGYRTQP